MKSRLDSKWRGVGNCLLLWVVLGVFQASLAADLHAQTESAQQPSSTAGAVGAKARIQSDGNQETESKRTYQFEVQTVTPPWQFFTDEAAAADMASYNDPALGNDFIFQPRWWLGVECVETPPALMAQLQLKSGLLVNSVAPESPAATAGVEPFDVIVRFAESPVLNTAQFTDLIQTTGEQTVELSLVRRGQPLEISVQAARLEQDTPKNNIVMYATVSEGQVDLRPIQSVVTRWQQMDPEQRRQSQVRMLLVRPGLVLNEQEDLNLQQSAILEDGTELVFMSGLATAGLENRADRILFREGDEVKVFGDAQMRKLPGSMKKWVTQVDSMQWQDVPIQVGGREIQFFPSHSVLGAEGNRYEVIRMANESVFSVDLNARDKEATAMVQLNVPYSDRTHRIRVREIRPADVDIEIEQEEANLRPGEIRSSTKTPSQINIWQGVPDLPTGSAEAEQRLREQLESRIEVIVGSTTDGSGRLGGLQQQRQAIQAAMSKLQAELEAIDQQLKQLESNTSGK